MNASEGITQKGFGVEYKKVVSTRSDKVGAHGDKASSPSATKASFNQSHVDTKKA